MGALALPLQAALDQQRIPWPLLLAMGGAGAYLVHLVWPPRAPARAMALAPVATLLSLAAASAYQPPSPLSHKSAPHCAWWRVSVPAYIGAVALAVRVVYDERWHTTVLACLVQLWLALAAAAGCWQVLTRTRLVVWLAVLAASELLVHDSKTLTIPTLALHTLAAPVLVLPAPSYDTLLHVLALSWW